MGVIQDVGKRVIFSLPSNYILMFHHISSNPKYDRSACKIETESFVRILDGLSYIPLEGLVKAKKRNYAALTFDDGLEDVYTVGYPLLLERSIPFTIYIVTEFLDKPGYLSTYQVREMINSGMVSLGSHGITHEKLTNLSLKEAYREIEESKIILEDKFGVCVSSYAYSHGQYTKEIYDKTRIYQFAVSAQSLPINCITQRGMYSLPRINMSQERCEMYSKLMGIK